MFFLYTHYTQYTIHRSHRHFFYFHFIHSFLCVILIFLRCRGIEVWHGKKHTNKRFLCKQNEKKIGGVNKENHSITCNYKKFTLPFVCFALLFRNHLISFVFSSVKCFSLSSLFSPRKKTCFFFFIWNDFVWLSKESFDFCVFVWSGAAIRKIKLDTTHFICRFKCK